MTLEEHPTSMFPFDLKEDRQLDLKTNSQNLLITTLLVNPKTSVLSFQLNKNIKLVNAVHHCSKSHFLTCSS